MDKIKYGLQMQTNEDFTKQAELAIKYLKRLNGKTVDLDAIRNIAIKFSVIKALLPYRTVDPELKIRLDKALKAVRKIENAVNDYGQITVNIEEKDLKGLGIAKQTKPIKKAPPDKEKELVKLYKELKKQIERYKKYENVYISDNKPKRILDDAYFQKEDAESKIEHLSSLIKALEAEPIKEAPAQSAPVETVKAPNDCFAREVAIKEIFTDENRFQNRKTAFSEISAQAVAENYDPNKFDPITVWFDPAARKLFVLSGHSRLEGMKRRKAKFIPAKMFVGTEAEAIQFARVDANRSAKEETLTEDLEAYRLMKKGDPKKNIEPATAKEIKASFKNKADTLDDLLHLAKDGKFITALSAESKSEYPFVERFARWTGQLRKELKLTNSDEDQIFNFLYSGAVKLHTLDYDSFKKLVKERKDSGAEKLFDCEGFQCNEVQELEEFLGDNKKAEIVRKIQALEENRAQTYDLLNTDNPYRKTYTAEEKQYKRMLIEQTDAEIAKLKDSIGMKVKKDAALFGLGYVTDGGNTETTTDDFVPQRRRGRPRKSDA